MPVAPMAVLPCAARPSARLLIGRTGMVLFRETDEYERRAMKSARAGVSSSGTFCLLTIFSRSSARTPQTPRGSHRFCFLKARRPPASSGTL
eukprot:1106452-Prymnesium_polylepis.1